MRFMMFVVVTAMVVLGTAVTVTQAADQKVTLMLGGKHCDSYSNDVETALKKVPGVKNVDLKIHLETLAFYIPSPATKGAPA